MNPMRRLLLSGVAPGMLLLNACAGGNLASQPVTVNLITAQFWAHEITTTVSGFAQLSLASATTLPSGIAALIQSGLTALTAADSAFQSVQSGQLTVHDLAIASLNAVTQLLGALVPSVPALGATEPVGMSIHLGMVVLTAFINAVPLVVPPVPAALHTAAAAMQDLRQT